MPLTGYLGSSFNKFGTKFWGLTLPQWGWDDKHLRGIFSAFTRRSRGSWRHWSSYIFWAR